MRNYENLKCWQLAHECTLNLYSVTRTFPDEERFGLVSQIRRAVVSIGSNLAEGSGRNSQADFARFVDIAIGSASQIEYQLRIAGDLGYLDEQSHVHLRSEIVQCRRMLFRFAQSLRPGQE